ncbi:MULTISPECIES: hypothetical protein [unclassified Streptomyces]|uniref:hypothetical protein n=1 Tax=unclassified Streptomyces TaxID=2593676 RepID=UPI002DD99399|nr:hypothetical protein [Streptomyces sp. NBC_01750]WSB01615.1 hypothetical protein OIE54_21310 [Streptomyces sp. NBC_01794]WSD34058.1 hypothetical protein OG966_20470 [Streptomyces sp. NBC_01750]
MLGRFHRPDADSGRRERDREQGESGAVDREEAVGEGDRRPAEGAKHWQALEYGDQEWQKVYFRLRNSVEGYNYAKNPLAEAIEASGSRRIGGIAAQTILLVFQLAHANRRKIKNWVETLALNGERPRRRTHHRHCTKPLGNWTPPPATSHPPAGDQLQSPWTRVIRRSGHAS